MKRVLKLCSTTGMWKCLLNQQYHWAYHNALLITRYLLRECFNYSQKADTTNLVWEIAHCFSKHSENRLYAQKHPQLSWSMIERAESLNYVLFRVIFTIDTGSSRHEDDKRKAAQTHNNDFVKTINLRRNLGNTYTSSLATMKELLLMTISLQSKCSNIFKAVSTDRQKNYYRKYVYRNSLHLKYANKLWSNDTKMSADRFASDTDYK